jgi:glutaminyl-tRNA synthetase
VQEKLVSGWDDPRMPTLSGMRRRGYTPEAIRNFCANIGVSKTNGITQISHLEYFLREDLNRHSLRVNAVLNPLKVVIENYPEGGPESGPEGGPGGVGKETEELEAINNPEDPGAGTRTVPFSKVLYIEQEDFREDPPKQFYRLAPGREVRLRYGYLITCREAIKDAEGNIVELRCTYDPETRGGNTPDGRKVKSTIHWVSAAHAIDAEVRLYDTLFSNEDPNEFAEGQDFTANLNPNSLKVLTGCKVEPGLRDAVAGTRYQFERMGYFCVDRDSTPGRPVFNRTIGLKDTWAKIEQKGQKDKQK